MRYPPEHKAATHRKILKDAARRLRAEGLTGAAVSTVMKDAGLTHGGFYKHFASKDDLVIASVREAFREIAGFLASVAEKSQPEAAWKAIVRTYLSAEHCDHPGHGCPVAALASELARADKRMKGRISREMEGYKTRLAPFMPGDRKSTRLNSSHMSISYAVFCLKK